MSENVIPNTVAIDPDNPSPGSSATVTVTLDKITRRNQAVSIQGAPDGYFSDLPDSIRIAKGTDQGSFRAVLSPDATGTGTITASCNRGRASGTCTASPSPP